MTHQDQPVAAQTQPADLDLVALRDHLQAAGWDAIAAELMGEVAARLEHPPGGGVWTITIDHSGRVRFTATRELLPTEGWLLNRSGWLLHLSRESQQLISITATLDSPARLPALLQTLQEVAQEQAGGQLSSTQGGTTWDQDQEMLLTTTDF